MIALDASVVIAHLDATDAHHDRAADLLADTAGEDLGISPITLAEILVGPIRTGHLAVARAVLERLRMETLRLPEDAPTRLASLRVDTGLRLPDCCALLVAQDCQQLGTFDERLARAAVELGLDVRR